MRSARATCRRGRGHARVPLGGAAPAPGSAGRSTCARSASSSPTRRSCSARQLILKAFRRVEPGVNPELELLRFLSRARLPAHRAAGRLVRVRGPADRRDARHPAGVPGGRAATAGSSRSTSSRATRRRSSTACARSARSPASCTRRSARTPATRRSRPRSRAREALVDPHRDDRRGDRARLPRPARERGARRRSRGRGAGRARAAAGAVARRRRRSRDPHPRRLPPRPDHARRPRLGDPRLRGRAGAAAARAPAASARRCATSRGCCARSPTRAPARELLRGAPRAGGLGGARARDVPRGLLRHASTSSLLPPGQRGDRASCWRSSSSRRPSTSCATSSTTVPTGSRSRWPGIAPAARLRLREGVECHRPPPTSTDRPREHANPHAFLGAHPRRRRGRPRVPAGRRRRSPCSSDDKAAGDARAGRTPAGVFEGVIEGAKLPLAYQLEVDYGESRDVHDRRPVPLPADDRRARPAPGRRGPPRGALRRASARTCARSRASRARRSRSGRRPRAPVSVVGDFNSWDGRLHPMRSLGSSGIWELFLPERRRRARTTSTRSSRRTARSRLKADPVAFAAEHPAEDRVGRAPTQARVGRRASGSSSAARRTPLRRPMSIYEVHLGSWRLNPLEGNRSLTYLELADELVGLRARHGLHPHRAAAGDGAPVHRLVGLPGDRLLRPDAALRLARRLPRVRRPPAPATASA